MTKAEIEQKLRRLGARRQRHFDESDAIQEAVAGAIAEARGVVPMERVAELLRMHRSSIYELYIGGSSDDEDSKGSAAEDRAGQGKPRPVGAKAPKAATAPG